MLSCFVWATACGSNEIPPPPPEAVASCDFNVPAGGGRDTSTLWYDANDRVVYNTSTGQLYYDDDGSGAHAAQLVATLQAGAVVAATDISVI